MNFFRRPTTVIAIIVMVLAGVGLSDTIRSSRAFLVLGVVTAVAIIVILCKRMIVLIKSGTLRRPLAKMSTPLIIILAAPIVYFALAEDSDFESRRMQIFKDGVEAMNHSTRAIQTLGDPIRVGWPVDNNSVISAQSGHAELAVHVYGSSSKAKLYIDGVKSGGQWTITDVYLVQPETNTQISLMHR
jgi:hypothetical protein